MEAALQHSGRLNDRSTAIVLTLLAFIASTVEAVVAGGGKANGSTFDLTSVKHCIGQLDMAELTMKMKLILVCLDMCILTHPYCVVRLFRSWYSRLNKHVSEQLQFKRDRLQQCSHTSEATETWSKIY